MVSGMRTSPEGIARVICASDLREAGIAPVDLTEAVERFWPVVAARIGQGDKVILSSLPADVAQREREYMRLTHAEALGANKH